MLLYSDRSDGLLINPWGVVAHSYNPSLEDLGAGTASFTANQGNSNTVRACLKTNKF